MMNLRYGAIMLALVMMTAASASGQGTPQDNLVHSYTFEEGPEDVVGSAHGTLAGSAEVVNGALLITENGAWMELPAQDIAINLFEEITVEILYTPAPGPTEDTGANTGFTMLAYFGGSTAGGLGADYFFISTARGDDVSRAAISIGNTTEPWSAESGANGPEYDDNVTHHMVSTLTNEMVTLYIDGVQTGSTPLAENNSIAGISTDFAYLGRGGYVNDPSWLGAIHEFNVYNRALTADEIAELYALATDIEREDQTLPNGFALEQNYPNPFNPSTAISYTVGQRGMVSLAVYDVLGHEVARLVDEQKEAGTYQVHFDATGLTSGIYFCTMRAPGFQSTRKMVLLR